MVQSCLSWYLGAIFAESGRGELAASSHMLKCLPLATDIHLRPWESHQVLVEQTEQHPWVLECR